MVRNEMSAILLRASTLLNVKITQEENFRSKVFVLCEMRKFSREIIVRMRDEDK